MSEVVNLEGVRRAIDAAKPAGSPPPDRPKPRDDGLPDDCPVVALGREGELFFYLDVSRQLRTLGPKDHSRLGIMSLFARDSQWLYKQWPRTDKAGNTTGWRPEFAAEELMDACARRGVWDMLERVRGPGAWLGTDGELVWHVGDGILVGTDGTAHPPGMVGRWVYPAAAPLPRPWPAPAAASMAEELLVMLCGWHWRRCSLDALLLLGWIGAAMIGGALPWRPVTWVTGGAGTGKSTLRDRVLEDLFDGALISVADTTEAGVRQKIGHATLPAVVDELEAEVDNRKAQAVIRLARLAASGGVMLRGGTDHKQTEFVVRSAFMFQSILMPPLSPQDRSRIAVLELGPLGDRPKPALDRARLREIGQALRRRLTDGWPRLARRIDSYRAELMVEAEGRRFDARGADVYGTMLACAEVLLFDDEEERAASDRDWAARVRNAELVEVAERLSDEQALLQYLLSSTIDPYRSGSRSTVAEWVHKAAGRVPDVDAKEANRNLGTYGLRVLPLGPPGAQTLMLAIANNHQGLASLLQNSHWASTPGAQAVWVQAARRLAVALGGVEKSEPIYFAGATSRAVLLPLASALPEPAPGEGIQGSAGALWASPGGSGGVF